ncbi:MAG: caspase family protein [Bacteroidota bacterium]|jgi:WD40 repeat protein
MLIKKCLFFTFSFLLTLKGKTQELRLGLPVGHTDLVRSVQASPNGKLAITASDDYTARIWDLATGKQMHVLKGHTEAVNSAVFSPDGRWALTAGDSTAGLYDVLTGNFLRSFRGQTSVVSSADFSPDSKLVLVVGDNVARVFDAATGKELHVLRGHKGWVNSAVFSPDGRMIATASDDSTACVYDVSTGKIRQVLEGHIGSVTKAVFSPDGKLLLTASKDYTSRIYDVASGKQIQLLTGHKGRVWSSVFSEDGKRVLTASDTKGRIFDVYTGSELHVFEGQNKGSVTSAIFSPDGKLIVTADDKTARIFEVGSGKELHVLRGHHGSVESICFSNDGKYILTAGDYAARIFEVVTGKELQLLQGQADWVSSALFSPNGELSITASFNTARIFEVATGKERHVLKGHTNYVNTAVFSEDGKLIVTSSDDKTSRIWEVETGKELQVLSGHSGAVISAKFSPDGRIVLTTSKDNTSRTWEVATGTQLHVLSGHLRYVSSANFSGNGLLVVSAEENTARIWEVKTGKELLVLSGHSGAVTSALFSPDSKLIVTASLDNTARIWDVTTGKELQVLSGHIDWLNSAVFSPDGRSVLTASVDNTARFWDVAMGKELKLFSLQTRSLESALFSPDGKKALTLSDARTHLFDVESGRLLHVLNGHTDMVISATFSPDGKMILTSSRDGSSILWNASTGAKLLQRFIFHTNNDLWLHLHPSGLFDASQGAMDLMYWTKNLEIIEFVQMKDRYWVPGLWDKVMKGEPLPDTRGMMELKLQPEVEMGELIDGKIPVKLTRRDGGYGKVSILINGKEVQADARGDSFAQDKKTQTIWVDLKDHPNLKDSLNVIAVKASSEDGFVIGKPVEKKVVLSLKRTVPHFYAVVIGTGKYVNEKINLKYPEKDAHSMSTALQLGAEQLFGKENTHIYTLTTASGDRPTKEKVKYIFSEISKKATSSDLIVIYLSGHGIAWGGDQGDFYYLTTDATAANAEAYNDEALRRNYTISSTEFTEYLKAIPANKQVMIIDACSSGKAVENLMAARDIDISSIKAIDRMKDRTGMYVISGSAADAVSYEASRYGQGLLTYSVLQAMKGAALRDGQFFDVIAILNYSRENVPKLAAGVGGVQTPQLLIPKGGSFDFGRVDDLSRSKIPLANLKPVFVRTGFIDLDAFSDELNFSKTLDHQLNQIAMRIYDAQLVFLDTREFPDAYRLSGGYTQSNGTITLKLKIKGPKESLHTLSAQTQEELVEQVLGIVEGLE